MQNRTKVRRRVLACARCRKRKLSCDGKVPSCTRCVDAGVACVGFDSSTQREAPRSIADFLEMHIASLEDPKSPSFRRPSRPHTAFPSPAASNDSEASWPGERCAYADDLVNQVMEDITPSFLGISKARPILSCVVRGTQIPSRRGPVGATDLDENHPRSIINPQPASAGLDGIDHQTAVGLFHNFIDCVMPQYPIYHRNDITAAFQSMYYPASCPGQDTPRHRYMMSIIMAISMSTAARTNQQMANMHAYSLVRHAVVQWIPEVVTNDLQGLQAILLLTQYIFINPSMADLWLLTGLISQAVIDLGLHQELPNDARVTPYQRDMRRRLFWCAWEMEVAVCSIFSRPINLPTRNISVAFPEEVDDTAITELGTDPNGRISKFTSRRIWLFRLIEAEIASVLYQNDPFPNECATAEQWVQKMQTKIFEWHNEVYRAAAANTDPSFEAGWKEMLLYAEIAYPYILVTLLRPSRLIPAPTTESLLVAFVSAVRVVDGYWQQSNASFGNIKYAFHPCHHSFKCAIVFLQALSRCKAEISEQYTYEQVEDWMSHFSRLLERIAERWPAATRCLEEYERLLAPVKRKYMEYLVQKSSKAPQHADTLGHMNARLYNYPGELEEAFNSWAVLNPTTAPISPDTLSAFSFNPPDDWNREFGFNFGVMDALPPREVVNRV